jgi:hypothetical protein
MSSTPRQDRSCPGKSKRLKRQYPADPWLVPAAPSKRPVPPVTADRPFLKQVCNQQQISEAVAVSRLLIWPVVARLRWRVALW